MQSLQYYYLVKDMEKNNYVGIKDRDYILEKHNVGPGGTTVYYDFIWLKPYPKD